MTVTAEMFKPLTEAVQSNVDVILPVGVGIMVIMIGIGIIPRVIHKFV